MSGYQIAIAIAMLLSYVVYAVLYVTQLFHPIANVVFATDKRIPSIMLADVSQIESIDATKVDTESKSKKHNFAEWMIKQYHESTFFYTVCCLISIISYQNSFVVVVAYLGLVGKLGKVAGVFIEKESLYKIGHICMVICNLVILIISVIWYGKD